jgi:adenosylhomocysteine nucleosidase
MIRGSMVEIEPSRSDSGSTVRTFGLLAAMPEELGEWPARATDRHTRLGLEVLRIDVRGFRVLACVSGIGKVLAARAAVVLLSEGVDQGLLVVGTCGGLRQSLAPGTLLHCTTAAQVDLAHRRSREIRADPELRAAWRSVAPGPEGWFLTADRPVLSLVKRIRLARAFAGPCAADMETAAAAAVAAEAGIPFAGLRAVTDRATLFGGAAFRANYRTHAGRAADTVTALLDVLEGGSRVSHSSKPPVP